MDLSFVIIEYHCVEDAAVCVSGIEQAATGISHEIIVSSNSMYPRERQDELRRDLPFATWLFNERNLGFAGGMNAGIAATQGRAVTIINPDVIVTHGSLRQAFEYLMSHPEIGVIGPRIVDTAGNVQDSCREFMTPKILLSRVMARVFGKRDVLLDARADYTRVRAVDWVIGAMMMIRREALERVGALDPGYFLYVEDMDWCKRFWDNGFQVVYYPPLEVRYKGDRKSSSALISGQMINRYGFYHLRSYWRFLWKNKFRVSRKG